MDPVGQFLLRFKTIANGLQHWFEYLVTRLDLTLLSCFNSQQELLNALQQLSAGNSFEI
jgi:hypothetical protein